MAPSRSVDETRQLWQKLLTSKSILSLTALKSSVISGNQICDSTLRSMCWKLFMLLPDLQPETWGNTLGLCREKYTDLKKKFLTHNLSDDADGEATEDLNVANPLSQDESNPWKTFWKDEDARKDILQDIERTFPDIEYFRDPKVQETLLDILFVFVKMNPQVGYQQGMHELLAPIFYVVATDAIEVGTEVSDDDKVMCDALSSEFIEHDSFTLFNYIMENAWEWFAAQGKTKGPTENGRVTPPIVIKSRKIQQSYLRKIDPELEHHLRELEIEPQMWGMRWIRLLFGREFAFDQMMSLWDCLFAADAQTLKIVDFVCVAMLIRIHDQLLLADYTGALTLLLHYPVTEAMTPNSFVEDALYLQVHISSEGGRRIMQQYGVYEEPEDDQQPLRIVNGVLVPSTRDMYQRRAAASAATVEKAVQGIARNVFENGEKWSGDVNRFVRQKVQDAKARGVQYLTSESFANSARPYLAAAQVPVGSFPPIANPRVMASSTGNTPRKRATPQRRLPTGGANFQTRSPAGNGSAHASPQSAKSISSLKKSSAFDEEEYMRERNEALAAILGTSLAALSDGNSSDMDNRRMHKEAIARIEYVRKCLIFEDMKIDKSYTVSITALQQSENKNDIRDRSLTALPRNENSNNQTGSSRMQSPIAPSSRSSPLVNSTDPLDLNDPLDSLASSSALLSLSSSTNTTNSLSSRLPVSLPPSKTISRVASKQALSESVESAKALLFGDADDGGSSFNSKPASGPEIPSVAADEDAGDLSSTKSLADAPSLFHEPTLSFEASPISTSSASSFFSPRAPSTAHSSPLKESPTDPITPSPSSSTNITSGITATTSKSADGDTRDLLFGEAHASAISNTSSGTMSVEETKLLLGL
ncbi:rab-GTPase-TBC domain-containing protein [Lipomyces oligophaga]|uniref:rab-GTPase-TBC domain-containing protein n=1 Tax=Lipomyces oligophaga TaxID=45792 RepID=UPI0034CE3AE0